MACGSCHDDVNFATGANHPGGPQFDDTQCATCHIPQGEIDFDASILGAHVVPTASSLLSGLAVTITKVANGTAGSAPTVSFTVQNNAGARFRFRRWARSRSPWRVRPPTTATPSSGATPPRPVTSPKARRAPVAARPGTCTYTFTNVVPAKATGTYAIGVEARETQVLNSRHGGDTKHHVWSAERGDVLLGGRLAGHAAAHGGRARQLQSVPPDASGSRSAAQQHRILRDVPQSVEHGRHDAGTGTVAPYKAQPPQGINFNLLVHRIHYGINMQAVQPDLYRGRLRRQRQRLLGHPVPGAEPDRRGDRYGELLAVPRQSSEQNDLTLTGLNPVIDPQGPINPIQPFSSACTGCHVDLATASHSLSNTTSLGEACAVCHSSGAV